MKLAGVAWPAAARDAGLWEAASTAFIVGLAVDMSIRMRFLWAIMSVPRILESYKLLRVLETFTCHTGCLSSNSPLGC